MDPVPAQRVEGSYIAQAMAHGDEPVAMRAARYIAVAIGTASKVAAVSQNAGR